jgi:hypothetical protein
MAITTAMCNSFKLEILTTGIHDFTTTTGDVFKVALFQDTATLGEGTTDYDNETANEVPNGNGYTTGGENLTNVTPVIAGTSTAIVDFSNDVTWTPSTITARGCLIYNSSNGNVSISAHDFGENKSSNNGDFTLIMPAPTAGAAIIRIGPGT